MPASSPRTNAAIPELIVRIQKNVYPRRIRVREFFLNFDSLRSGRCTRQQFARALGLIGMRLVDAEVEALTAYYTERGPRVQKPQEINYEKFCQAVDEVFVISKLEGCPHPDVPEPGSTLRLAFQPNAVADEERLEHILCKCQRLCETRGVVLKYCFQDFERSASAAPASVNPRMAGKVTINQFRRHFPFKKEFSEDDLNLLIDRYTTENGDFHFQALHNEVSEVVSDEPQPFPRSDHNPRPDTNEWSHHRLTPVQKLQAKVVEKRVRLYEHFQDFDALRKGHCTVGQVKTVFAILNLERELERADFDALIGGFLREDGMFCYRDFCSAIDNAFTTPGLDKAPDLTLAMPDATTTAPARRNRRTLTLTQKQQVQDLEEMIRSRVRVRRPQLRQRFRDMDRTNRNHITRSQFARVMHMLGFELSAANLESLCAVYCDFGNHSEFNYLDFCASCDPPMEEEAIAMRQQMSEYYDPPASRYFDSRGAVLASAGRTLCAF
eukprot:NODE_4999_length_1821_cov_13.064345.p1 GENE.NODE_4999_length_1821_cov_13.064345~~NODE_4999_length_1821_cov_13.064345.p1  ORF type:complete len:517 (+),score=181.25 NODE_4999_length_1821_cov_13.064345:66-1553(+)